MQLDRDVALKEYMPVALALRDPDSTVLPRAAELADDFHHGRERFFDEAKTLVGEAAREARGGAIAVVYTSGHSIDPPRQVKGSIFLKKPYEPDEVVKACHALCPGKKSI